MCAGARERVTIRVQTGGGGGEVRWRRREEEQEQELAEEVQVGRGGVSTNAHCMMWQTKHATLSNAIVECVLALDMV